MRKHSLLATIALSAMMIISLIGCGGQASAQANETKEQVSVREDEAAEPETDRVEDPTLLKAVTMYEMDFQTGEWRKKEVVEYEYENAYPVKIRHQDFDAESEWQYTYEYSFSDGLPVEMKEFDSDGTLTGSVKYDENGRRDRDYVYAGNGNSTTERIYQYGNRDQYFTMVHHETLNKEEGFPDDHAEEVDSIIVTTENDLLKKTVNDGIYANWGDEDVKEWVRFMGSYTVEYDENGIAKDLNSLYSVGIPESNDKNEITFENGHVTEVTYSRFSKENDDDPDGTWQAFRKYEFEYTDVPISRARYASMINNIIMEGGGTFYIYNWY